MPTTADYDAQIARLLKTVGDLDCVYIRAEWVQGLGIFRFVTPTGDPRSPYWSSEQNELHYGCLTMIADCGEHIAWTPELTKAIRKDKDNLPKKGSEITPAHLPRFKAWWEFIDRYFASGCNNDLLQEAPR